MKDREEVALKHDICYFEKGWKQTIGNFTKVYVKGADGGPVCHPGREIGCFVRDITPWGGIAPEQAQQPVDNPFAVQGMGISHGAEE